LHGGNEASIVSHWPVISEKLFTFINEELPNVSRGLLVVTGRAAGGGYIFLKITADTREKSMLSSQVASSFSSRI